MNKTISIIRIAILIALGMVATLLIFGEEQEADLLSWTLRFVVDKAVGIGTVFLFTRLYKRWFAAHDKMSEEAMDKPKSTPR